MDAAATPETRHFLDYWRVIRARKETIIAVALMIIVAGLLITLSLPKKYRASVRMAVSQVEADVPLSESRSRDMWHDPFFMKTQLEIIQSQLVLDEVIRNLGLCDRFAAARKVPTMSPSDARKELASSIKVDSYLDTNIIEIKVYRKGSDQAVLDEVRDIANEIAEVYKQVSTKKAREKSEKGLSALEDARQKYGELVAEKEKKVERLRKELDITKILSSRVGPEGETLGTLRLQALESARLRARREMLAQKVLLDKLQVLDREQQLNMLARGDTTVKSLRKQVADSKVVLEQLSQTRGENHPDVMRQRTVVQELERELDETIQGAVLAIESDYEISRQNYEVVAADLEAVRQDEIRKSGERYLPFFKAEEELRELKAQRQRLEFRAFEEEITLDLPQTPVMIIDEAESPKITEHVAPNFLLNLLLSIVVGVGCGIALAFFAEYIDTSIKTIEDIEQFVGTPVLGVIPQKVKVLAEAGRRSPHAESYRVLRTNMQFSKRLGGGKAICVTSGGSGEGKSFTISNLAYVTAQLGNSVLVVDSDLRRPTQHKIFELSRKPGLTDVLQGKLSVEEAVQNGPIAGLQLLTGGRSTVASAGLLDTQAMRDLMKYLKSKYDWVLFDSPPIIGVSDASVIVSEVDATLLVIQPRSYPKVLAGRAKKLIDNVGGNLIGVVLNNINISRDYYYYYHSYPGKYGYAYLQPDGGMMSESAADEESAALADSEGSKE